jgi:hypothetical protein
MEQAAINGAFHRLADERWARFLQIGETVPRDEARAWIGARAGGEKPRRPIARRRFTLP